MPVACLVTLGLLCLTAGEGKLANPSTSFGSLSTYETPTYRIEYEHSDVHTPRDVSRYKALCRGRDCVRVKATAEGCAMRFELVAPSDPMKAWTGVTYRVRATTKAGLTRGLEEAQVAVREGRTDVFRSLRDVAGGRVSGCSA